MASRAFFDRFLTLEEEVIYLFAQITVGSSGAIASTDRGKGVTSVVETGTGRYTLTLDDKYARLLWADAQVMRATGTVDLKLLTNLETVASTKTVEFGVTKSSDGTVVDAASGDIIRFVLVLGNTVN